MNLRKFIKNRTIRSDLNIIKANYFFAMLFIQHWGKLKRLIIQPNKRHYILSLNDSVMASITTDASISPKSTCLPQ